MLNFYCERVRKLEEGFWGRRRRRRGSGGGERPSRIRPFEEVTGGLWTSEGSVLWFWIMLQLLLGESIIHSFTDSKPGKPGSVGLNRFTFGFLKIRVTQTAEPFFMSLKTVWFDWLELSPELFFSAETFLLEPRMRTEPEPTGTYSDPNMDRTWFWSFCFHPEESMK